MPARNGKSLTQCSVLHLLGCVSINLTRRWGIKDAAIIWLRANFAVAKAGRGTSDAADCLGCVVFDE